MSTIQIIYWMKSIERSMRWHSVLDTPNLSSWHNKIELLFGFQPSYTQVSKFHNVGKIIQVSGACENTSHPHHWVFTYRALRELISIHNFKILKTCGATDGNIFSQLI